MPEQRVLRMLAYENAGRAAVYWLIATAGARAVVLRFAVLIAFRVAHSRLYY